MEKTKNKEEVEEKQRGLEHEVSFILIQLFSYFNLIN